MSLKKYLWDKFVEIFIGLTSLIIEILLLNAFKVEFSLKMALILIFVVTFLLLFFIDYFKKHSFYQDLVCTLDSLDQKYLILEMIHQPNFYEGEIFYQTLYEINKSMIEKINEYRLNICDFKEYVEMWIHEVKIPISSLTLLNHNHPNEIEKSYIQQIRKLDHYIDQILYYVRSENASRDYLIQEKDLKEIIKNVALKEKDDLLENDVKLEVNVGRIKVLTDAKWLEFILSQIINNSIKYQRMDVASEIMIEASVNEDKIFLSILDNGIGIPEGDIPRVFEKSFTGSNGRLRAKSTGMGLYIAKKLCEKLGHKIKIESKIGEYTKVIIIFLDNDFYRMK